MKWNLDLDPEALNRLNPKALIPEALDPNRHQSSNLGWCHGADASSLQRGLLENRRGLIFPMLLSPG